MRTPFRKSHGKITLVVYNHPHPCGGNCLYCFSTQGYTRSTTPNEDTELARSSDWDASKQLRQRFINYGLSSGVGLKCDIAVKGDSFGNHPPEYLRLYFKGIYDFLNQNHSGSLREAMQYQRIASDKCVSVKVETRPDHISEESCELFTELGVTTVELGVQSLDDEVLKRNKRGHNSEAVASATRMLRKRGFEVGYQVMVGLPGSSYEKDFKLLSTDLWTDDFSPDALKIYPCLLLNPSISKQKALLGLFSGHSWKPIKKEEYVELLFQSYPFIPSYVHINRIQRIIPTKKINAGVSVEIDRNIFSSISKCLWQRSVAQKSKNLNKDFSNFEIISYPQGEQRYCFEAISDSDIVLGYGRLDIYSQFAIIRDVRVLGNMLTVGADNTKKMDCQHIGIGSSLVNMMEKKAAEQGSKRIMVKPAFGAFSWFKKLNYDMFGKYYMYRKLSLTKRQ